MEKSNKKGSFDMGKFLSSKGYSLGTVDEETGQITIYNKDGQAGALETSKILSKYNVKPEEVDITYNSPDTALEDSPAGFMDRVTLKGMGNTRGQLEYLKKQYEEVQYHPNNGLVVKNKGLWQKIDPEGLGSGSPWDKTKELAKDIVDNYDIAITQVPAAMGAAIGGTMGAAAGGVGAVPGAAAGAAIGGMVGETIKTSLGRLYGTFKATPEEQLQDIGWEGMFNMGGEALALGVKPTWNKLKNSLTKFRDKAANYTKEASSSWWSMMTGESRESIRNTLDNPEPIITKARQVYGEIGNKAPSEGLTNITRRQIGIFDQMASESDIALKSSYRKQLEGLKRDVPDDFTADFSGIISGAQKDLVGMGIATPQVDSAGNFLGIKLRTDGKVLTSQQQEVMSEFVDISNKFLRKHHGKKISGPRAAEELVQLRKSMRETYDDLITDELRGSTSDKLAMTFKEKLDTGIGQAFSDNSVGGSSNLINKFTNMNQTYAKHADAVKLLKRAQYSKEPGAKETVIRKLTSKEGSNVNMYDDIEALAEILPNGQTLTKELVEWEDTKAFQGLVARSYGGNSAVSTLKAAASFLGQTNPRAVLKQIEYGEQLNKMFRSMKPESIDALLANDQNFGTVIRSVTDAMDSEDSSTEQILQQAGVK